MSDELLFHLKYGSGPWNVWRRENPNVPIALDGANLNGLILTGIDFSRASLRGASLHAANLHECDLLGADLTNARCSGDDLAGALHVPPAKAR